MLVVVFEAAAFGMIAIKECGGFVSCGEAEKLYHELVSFLYSKVMVREEISSVSKGV